MLLLLLLLQSLLSAALLSLCAFFSIPCHCCHCCSFLPSFCLPFRLIHFHTYFAVVSPLFFSCPPFVAFLFGDQNLPELLLPLSTKKQPVEREKELIHHGKSICHLQQLFFSNQVQGQQKCKKWWWWCSTTTLPPPHQRKSILKVSSANTHSDGSNSSAVLSLFLQLCVI